MKFSQKAESELISKKHENWIKLQNSFIAVAINSGHYFNDLLISGERVICKLKDGIQEYASKTISRGDESLQSSAGFIIFSNYHNSTLNKEREKAIDIIRFRVISHVLEMKQLRARSPFVA